ncbi:MAG: T9SS type A sorting domain-containing protein, partial [Bacteroidota bacterium]
ALLQNYPNPFNPSTTMRYDLPEQSHVALKIYDLLGREVGILVDEVEGAGSKSVQFDASRLASGVYFYRLSAAAFVQTKKLILVR